MNVRLFIDGIEAELAENTEVAITRQAANVLQLDKRQLDFSNRVTIPATPKNIELMEYLGYNGNTSARPYKYAPARLEVNGITYADKLVCICDGIEADGFEIRLLGDPFNYLDQMKGKQLRDVLDFFVDGGVHNLDINTWKTFQAATGGITYPLIEQLSPFVAFPKTRLYIDLSYPAIYTKDLMEKMLNQYFTSVVSDAITNEIYLKDVLFATDTQNEVWKDYEQIIVDKQSSFNWSFLTVEQSVWMGINYSTFVDKDNKNTCLYYDQTGIDPDAFKFEGGGITVYESPANRMFKMKIETEFVIDNIDPDQRYRLEVYLRPRINVLIDPDNDILIASSDWYSANGTFKIENEIDVFQRVDQGLYFVFKSEYDQPFVFPPSPISIPYPVDLTINYFKYEINHDKQSLHGDQYMNPKLIMPDCTEFDFFMDQVKRFGLIFQTRLDGSIRLESFKDVLSGKFGADIWTNKLVRVVSTNYELGDYGRKAYIQYKGERDGNLLEGYNGWGFWTNDNDRYEEEKVVIESKGEAVRQYVDYYQPPFGNALSVGSFDLENNNTSVVLNPDKGLIYGRVNANDEFAEDYRLWFLNDGAFTGNTGQVLQPFEFASNVSLAELATNIGEFYGNLIDSLERPIVREVEVYLSEVDFYNLDFFKLIYLEQFQKYHYLLSVSNYIPGKIVKAKLLEVKGEIIIPKCCDYLVEGINLMPVITDYCVKYIFQELDWDEYDGSFVQLIGQSSDGITGHTWFNLTAGNTGLSQPTTDQLLDLIEERFDDDDGRWTLTRLGNEITICTSDFETLTVVNISLASGNSQYAPFPAIEVVSNYQTSPLLSPLPIFGELYITNTDVQPNRFEVLVNGEWEDVTDDVTEDGTWSRTSCDQTITQWRILDIEDNVIDNGSVNCEQNG